MSIQRSNGNPLLLTIHCVIQLSEMCLDMTEDLAARNDGVVDAIQLVFEIHYLIVGQPDIGDKLAPEGAPTAEFVVDVSFGIHEINGQWLNMAPQNTALLFRL